MTPLRLGTMAFDMPPFAMAVASAVLAEQQGYDFVSHFDQTNGFYPPSLHTEEFTAFAALIPDMDAFFDPTAAIVASVDQTESIRFIYGVIDSIRRPPHVIAQTMLTLDHATRGRTISIVASGEAKQLRPYGLSRKGANDKLWDCVHIIRRFLDSSEPVSYEGRVWNLDRALLSLGPYGERPPSFWVAGGGPEVLHLVATQADGWLTYAPGATEDDPEVYRTQVEDLRRRAKEAGRDPDEISLCLEVHTVLAEDEGLLDELRDHPIMRWVTMMVVPNSAVYKKWNLEHPFGDNWAYSASLIPYQYTLEEALDVCERTPREAVDHVWFLGTPEQALDRLKPYIAAGVTDMLLINWAPAVGAPDLTPTLFKELRALTG